MAGLKKAVATAEEVLGVGASAAAASEADPAVESKALEALAVAVPRAASAADLEVTTGPVVATSDVEWQEAGEANDTKRVWNREVGAGGVEGREMDVTPMGG